MVDFRHMYGAVYILENFIAQRVKIGMTIGNIADRLDDVNDTFNSSSQPAPSLSTASLPAGAKFARFCAVRLIASSFINDCANCLRDSLACCSSARDAD